VLLPGGMHGSVASRLSEADGPAWVVHGERGDGGITDDPAARITRMERCYYSPFGKAPGICRFAGRALFRAPAMMPFPGQGAGGGAA
jgi:hypothetical protein